MRRDFNLKSGSAENAERPLQDVCQYGQQNKNNHPTWILQRAQFKIPKIYLRQENHKQKNTIAKTLQLHQLR